MQVTQNIQSLSFQEKNLNLSPRQKDLVHCSLNIFPVEILSLIFYYHLDERLDLIQLKNRINTLAAVNKIWSISVLETMRKTDLLFVNTLCKGLVSIQSEKKMKQWHLLSSLASILLNPAFDTVYSSMKTPELFGEISLGLEYTKQPESLNEKIFLTPSWLLRQRLYTFRDSLFSNSFKSQITKSVYDSFDWISHILSCTLLHHKFNLFLLFKDLKEDKNGITAEDRIEKSQLHKIRCKNIEKKSILIQRSLLGLIDKLIKFNEIKKVETSCFLCFSWFLINNKKNDGFIKKIFFSFKQNWKEMKIATCLILNINSLRDFSLKFTKMIDEKIVELDLDDNDVEVDSSS